MSRFSSQRDAAPIYDAAQIWKDRCLLANRSMLSDNKLLWTRDLVNEPDRDLFVDNFAANRGSFISNLEHQLSNTSPECKQMLAEFLWILLLFPSNIRVETKIQNFQAVWSWSGDELNRSQRYLNDEVLAGIGSAGAAFGPLRWRELVLLLDIVRDLKERDSQELTEILWDPWAFSDWIFQIPEARGRQFGHMLSHLLFPDFFERITSETHKRRVQFWFDNMSMEDISKQSVTKMDQSILKIRGEIEDKYGEEIDFYDPRFSSQWMGKKWIFIWKPSDFIWDTFTRDRNVTMANRKVNIKWKCETKKLKQNDRVYIMKSEVEKPGIIASGKVKETPYKGGGYVELELDVIREIAKDKFISKDDLLAIKIDLEWESLPSIREVDFEPAKTLEQAWSNLPQIDNSTEPSIEAKIIMPDSSHGALNLILYGPPGTGKTYTLESEYMPKYRDGDESRYEFITFHQNYAYDDFVEGIRPVDIEGTITYQVLPGVLKRICEEAQNNPSERYALFIDEINRGDISKIFGEVITLLEPSKRIRTDSSGKRIPGFGLEVTLPYSHDKFGIPSNLDVICTMNTTDRNMSLPDNAFRRRFRFIEYTPDSTYLGSIDCDDGSSIDMKKLLDTVNERLIYLLGRDLTIGHSYFIGVRNFDDLRSVIAMEILPLLQESFYNDLHQVRYVLADQDADEHLQLVKVRSQNIPEIFPNAEQLKAHDGKVFEFIQMDSITPASIRKIYEKQK